MIFLGKSKRAFNKFIKRLIYFGHNSSIQGLKYVFQKDGTPLSRVIWLLLLLVFCGCLYLLLVSVVQRGGSVSIALDTSYLDWNTKFPAVTVCEKYSQNKVIKIITEYLPELGKHTTVNNNNNNKSTDTKKDADKLPGHISDIIYGRGHSPFNGSLPHCGNTSMPCDLPWVSIIYKVHKKCSQLISECNFNKVKFSCCEHFKIVDSESGPCYSFNSLQAPNTEGPQFFVNRSTGPGVLSFRLLYDAQISVHSSEELSTNFLDKTLGFEVVLTSSCQEVDYLFSIVEVINEAVLENEDINVRKCRYDYEIPDLPLHTYQVYSYGACRLAKSTEETFNICHCVHPIREKRYEAFYCNYTGIACLINIQSSKKSDARDKSDAVDAIDCLPSCVENDLNAIHLIIRKSQPEQVNSTGQHNTPLVNIRMASLPSMRYKTSLLRTNLDFVVTIAGMVGLFFSASILSFAEIFYLILRSPNINK